VSEQLARDQLTDLARTDDQGVLHVRRSRPGQRAHRDSCCGHTEDRGRPEDAQLDEIRARSGSEVNRMLDDENADGHQ
jgi:hypothetical protein